MSTGFRLLRIIYLCFIFSGSSRAEFRPVTGFHSLKPTPTGAQWFRIKKWIASKSFAAGQALLTFLPFLVELPIKLLAATIISFPFLARAKAREGKVVIHMRSVEMPKAHAHSQETAFIPQHLAHRASVGGDHVARMHSLRETLALIVDDDC